MNPHDDACEQLMHSVLDGECTPAEAKQLAELLESDDEARVLFHELKAIHEQCDAAITQNILGQGKSAQDIIHTAQRKAQYMPEQPNAFKRFLGSQFASGLAAGLLLATLLLTWFDRNPSGPAQPLAKNKEAIQGDVENSSPHPFTSPTIPVGDPVQRGIDLYDYTDDGGTRWLIESLREDSAPNDANRQDF